jgi:hypothetical protein
MDDQMLGSVREALQRYQATVASSNFNSLRILVEGMLAQPAGKIQPEWAEKLRLTVFNKYLGVDVRDFASSLQDLLSDEVRPVLISRCAFDGCYHTRNDLERRERWFETIRTRILELGVSTEPFPPPELRHTASTVSGVCGPGLHYWRVPRQFALLDLLLGEEQLVLTKYRVLVPIKEGGETSNNLTGIWEEWEIALAVKIGSGPRSWGGSYVLYCRNDEYMEWKWRYGVHDDDWRSDVYDTLEAYLEFYAHFREQKEEKVRKDVRPLLTLV